MKIISAEKANKLARAAATTFYAFDIYDIAEGITSQAKKGCYTYTFPGSLDSPTAHRLRELGYEVITNTGSDVTTIAWGEPYV